jgi:hypothetical protein
MVVLTALQAHAWDAYTQFNATENSSASLWQYASVTAGSNTGYSLLPGYYSEANPGWKTASGGVPFVGPSSALGAIVMHPYVDGTAAVAAAIVWQSPTAGSVTVTFSVADAFAGGTGSGDNGVDYWLFKQGDATALASGYVAVNGTTGTLSVPNVAVSTGEKLYLQIGPHYAGNSADFFCDSTAITFTISHEPEWDAYNQFSATENSDGGVWQYASITAGGNGGYSLLPAYYSEDYPGWKPSSGGLPFVGPSSTLGKVLVHPYLDGTTAVAAVVAWQSPTAGTVDATFSVTDAFDGGAGSGDNGVDYWLFKQGDATALASGYVAVSGTTGTLSVPSVTVSPGDKLYLQIGPHYTGNSSDFFCDSTAITFSITNTVSHGRQVILYHGLQIQALVFDYASPGFTDINLWLSANFTTINFWGSLEPELLEQMPAGTTWSRIYDPNGSWTRYLSYDELPYLDDFVSFQYTDEPADIMSRLPEFNAAFREWNALYPNALAHTDFPGYLGYGYAPATFADLVTYMQATRPDMLMFNDYPTFDFPETGMRGRNTWYSTMQNYRSAALQGYDGTGRHPIIYGQYLNLYRASYTAALPSESFVRLQQFASWTFGYTFVSGFVYNEPAGADVYAVMFNSAGDTNPNTTTFNYVANANTESQNLGPALIRLTSTDIRMKPARTGRKKVWDFWPFTYHYVYTYLSLPSGISEWSTGAGGCSYITSITPRGTDNSSSPLTYCDWLIGYFQPLLADNGDYPYANGLHFMITNGASQGTAAAAAQYVRIEFDFTGTSYNALQRLSRATGETEVVTLTSLGSNKYRLDLKLDGGTGDLFRFYPQ